MSSFCVNIFDSIENPADSDSCFTTAVRNLTLNIGSTYKISFILTKDGSPSQYLTGYSARGVIKPSASSSQVLLTMNTANLLLTIDDASSLLNMYIPESFTRRVTNPFAYYEIELLNPLSQTRKIVQGIITFA
jgi:hypothetical protein